MIVKLPSGNKVRVHIHFGGGERPTYRGVCKQRYADVQIEELSSGFHWEARAWCSPLDVFTRFEGRKAALKKLLAERDHPFNTADRKALYEAICPEIQSKRGGSMENVRETGEAGFITVKFTKDELLRCVIALWAAEKSLAAGDPGLAVMRHKRKGYAALAYRLDREYLMADIREPADVAQQQAQTGSI